ncbi:MAG: ABC transporter permease subunit [Mycoplasma sp.]
MFKSIQSNEPINFSLFKDSIIHGKKRKQSTKNILATVFSIASALIVALLVATALGYNPFDILSRLFTVGFQDLPALFSNIGVFCFAGLSFAFASKVGLFNIGISGQMLAAGTMIVFVTQAIPEGLIPSGSGQFIILMIAATTGALVATFTGILDAYLKINSVVSSILLNWIIYFISFFLLATFARSGGADDLLTNSAIIPDNFRLWDTQFGTGGIIPIIVLIIFIGGGMLILFKFTVFGQKIKSIGLSESASKYAGYDVKKIKISAFAISGAIAGVLACVLYTTKAVPAIPLDISLNSVPIEGFNGIAISLIGANNPVAIFAISALFGLFQNSIPGIVIPATYINLLIGLLMLGAALSVVAIKFKPWQYIKTFKYDKKYYKACDVFENNMDALISKYKSIITFEKKAIFDQIGEKGDKLIAWNETIIEIAQDYETEKRELLNSWTKKKVQMMLDKEISFGENYAAKKEQIDKYYESSLSKELAKIELKYETKLETSKQKAKEWTEKDIAKLKESYTANLTTEEKFNKTVNKIKKEISRIEVWENIPTLNKKDVMDKNQYIDSLVKPDIEEEFKKGDN